MKLSFHGAKYEYHPSELAVTEEQVGGVYRGSPCKIHRFKHLSHQRQSSPKLTYRGISYQR